MEPLSDLIINNLLRTNEQGILFQREDDQVEFKAIFDNSSKEAKAKYAKELAALYNCKGGYLIFGVDDKTNKLVGLEGFSEPDNADLSIVINGYFSPAIPFKTMVKVIDEKKVFIIYVPKRELIPTICQKNHPATLTKSTIYWRYSGQAASIEPGDLQNLFNEVRGEESKKQTEIAEKAYRAQYRPKLFIRGTDKGQGEICVKIQNRGPVAHFQSVEILTQNSQSLYGPSTFRWPIHGAGVAQLQFHGFELLYNQLEFTFAIDYTDDEGYRYRAVVSCLSGNSCIVNIEEIVSL